MEYREVRVNPDGSGDFRTLTQAAAAVPRSTPVRFVLAAGVYAERPFLEFENYQLTGAGAGKTVITADAAGRDPFAGEPKRGTFRSQTLFLGGGRARVSRLTVQNTAGDGALRGQAPAVYADAAFVTMYDVALEGNQDTLFTAPLPLREREPGGFRGPRENAPRRPSEQYYRNCRISGNVDFIFGGADAVFDRCKIMPLAHSKPYSYICAPSTPQGQNGYLFAECEVCGTCPEHSVYLGRPWREYGEAMWLDCRFDGEIHPDVWDDWSCRENRVTSRFLLLGNTDLHPAFGLPPTEEAARRALERVKKCRAFFSEESDV